MMARGGAHHEPVSMCATDLELGRGRVKRVVHEVADKGSKAPVVAAVLEEVEKGHGVVGEAMDEKRL